ncbi:zinc metallopeptidase [Proteobacteria bacterium 005FR1]|nr:zinc metallopeptidase [Proteobacteria bacterium 005FR1]
MLFILITALLLLLIYAPTLWVRYNMHRHSKTIDDMPGTGGELAKHLIERFGMDGFVVEQTDRGDHFDPSAKAVRLSADNYNGKSLTAVAVAAHEVGHAIQCFKGESIFELRGKYIPIAMKFKRWGILLLAAAPVAALVLKAPAAIFLLIAVSLLFQLIGTLAYLIVLPEEWDASFGKALPILIEGNYIPSTHIDSVRQVLKAAALTYFAGALADMLNLGRWLLLLRR